MAFASSELTPEPDAKGLQELWASAYEGWIRPAGLDEVVYLSPASTPSPSSAPEGQCDAPWAPWVEATLKLADQYGGLYGVTAFNPMGQDKPHAENTANNVQLEQDVIRLCEETGGTWWRSFGFAEDWHEKGFTVAAPEDKMVELAKKYKQGAVYRFYRKSGAGCGPPFLRATVPALLPDTEADVPMVPAARPGFARADPSWTPVE